MAYTLKSAFEDHRFHDHPLRSGRGVKELYEGEREREGGKWTFTTTLLDVGVEVEGEKFWERYQPGGHGIVLGWGGRSATFLPKVMVRWWPEGVGLDEELSYDQRFFIFIFVFIFYFLFFIFYFLFFIFYFLFFIFYFLFFIFYFLFFIFYFLFFIFYFLFFIFYFFHFYYYFFIFLFIFIFLYFFFGLFCFVLLLLTLFLGLLWVFFLWRRLFTFILNFLSLSPFPDKTLNTKFLELSCTKWATQVCLPRDGKKEMLNCMLGQNTMMIEEERGGEGERGRGKEGEREMGRKGRKIKGKKKTHNQNQNQLFGGLFYQQFWMKKEGEREMKGGRGEKKLAKRGQRDLLNTCPHLHNRHVHRIVACL